MPERFKDILLELWSSVEIYELKALLELLTLAHQPYDKPFLWELFGGLGAVHLLVLSGAHVQYFIRAIERLVFIAAKLMNIQISYRLKAILLWGLWVYMSAAAFPVSLVRASFCWAVSRMLFPAKTVLATLFALLLHVALFPQHLSSRGFYLSWTCYLLVLMIQRIGLRAVSSSVILVAIAQFVLTLCGDQKVFNIQVYSLYVLSNLCLLYLCDKFLFPWIGYLLGVVLFLSLLPEFIAAHGVSFLSVTLIPMIIFGAKIVYLAAELLRNL